MSERYDHGPLRSYEVTWTNGHVETLQAHQVTMPTPPGFFGGPAVKTQDFIRFHGEFDGRWLLVLAVRPEEISSIRDKATEEVL